MGTLQNTVDGLRAKKQEASRARRQFEKQLKGAKSVMRRSKSGLASADRQIESAQEGLSDASLILNQKTSQKDSILRLIESAEHRLIQDRDEKEQAQQDVEFADSADEKDDAQRRLRAILEKISDAEFEIKSRKKAAKKLADEIGNHSALKGKIADRIKKATKARPELRRLLKSSTADSERLSKKLAAASKREDGAKRRLKKAEEKLKKQAARRKPTAKKTKGRKKPASKTAPKKTRKTAAKTGPKRAKARKKSVSKTAPKKAKKAAARAGPKRAAKKTAAKARKKPATKRPAKKAKARSGPKRR